MLWLYHGYFLRWYECSDNLTVQWLTNLLCVFVRLNASILATLPYVLYDYPCFIKAGFMTFQVCHLHFLPHLSELNSESCVSHFILEAIIYIVNRALLNIRFCYKVRLVKSGIFYPQHTEIKIQRSVAKL